MKHPAASTLQQQRIRMTGAHRMDYKTANSHNTDRLNLCGKHAKGLLYLVTGFGWEQYTTSSTAAFGWYTGCDYGRNAPGTICNAPAEYLYERGA